MAQWTEEEIRYLKENYEKQEISKTMQELQRSKSSVKEKAKKLGLCLTTREEAGLWSQAEEEFLRKHYAVHSATELGKKLGRTKSSVLKKAIRLGLTANERAGYRVWNQDEIDYMMQYYQSQSLAATAKALNRTTSSVLHKAKKLGLTNPLNNAKPWTSQEEKYMEKVYLKQPVETTAKRLNRSIFSVKYKAQLLGLNKNVSEWCNAIALARCFQSDMLVIKRWILKLGLPARIVQYPTQARYLIDTEEFWKWAAEHKHQINWTRYIPLSLLPEPDWVEEARTQCQWNKRHQPITIGEKMEVRFLIRQGKTYQEIANQLGKTRSRISRIGKEIRLEMAARA